MGNIKEKLWEKPKYKGMSACVLTFLCMFTATFRPLYNGDIDNYTMSLVANKLFTGEGQDGYISYLNPLLCKLFEEVHAVLPDADCLTLTVNLMLLAAVWVFGYAIANVVRNRMELFVSYSLVYAIVAINDLFHDNFTRWAAFLSAAGIVVLLFASHRRLQEKRWKWIAVAFLSFGIMWRFEAFFVFLPYLFWDFAVQVLFGVSDAKMRKQRVLDLVKIAAVPMLCAVLLFAGNLVVRNSASYREAVAFDDTRSLVLDYPIKSWDEVKEQIPEISKNDYESAYGWVLLDTERVDTAFLNEMKEAGEKPAYGISVQDAVSMQKRVLSVFFDSRHLQYLCLIAVVLFFFVLISDMAWYYKVEALFLCSGTDLIYLLFAYLGRAIERVYITALYALLISMAVLLLAEAKRLKFCGIAVAVLACVGICYESMHGSFALNQSVFTASRVEEHAYEDLCQGEELYFWRVGQYVNNPIDTFMNQGKLLPTEFMKHHMYDGAWVYGQVYFEQFLEEIGAPNPMRALLEREDTYYVAEDCGYVLTYLQEHYNEQTDVVQISEIDGIPVWKFTVIK